MVKRTWESRSLNADEIDIKIEELERQILTFELMVLYEEKLKAFQTIYMEWYDNRLTLEEVLKAMLDRSICKRISVFER